MGHQYKIIDKMVTFKFHIGCQYFNRLPLGNAGGCVFKSTCFDTDCHWVPSPEDTSMQPLSVPAGDFEKLAPAINERD